MEKGAVLLLDKGTFFMVRFINLKNLKGFEVESMAKTKVKKTRWVQKVLKYSSGARLISVGKVIPRDWTYVVVEILEENENEIVLKLKRAKLIWG